MGAAVRGDTPGVTETNAVAYPCPACGAPADLTAGCSGCGRAPDPEAAEVIRLDGVINGLAAQAQRQWDAYQTTAAELADTKQRRDIAAARVRARMAPPPRPGATPPPGTSPLPGAAPPPAARPPAGPARPEASTWGIQTLLFVIGGLLLGTGAIVFTVVAWTTFGLAGQAAILAAVTALALAAPVVALRRRLRGTAETLAVLGVLLVLLDWYAAWQSGLVTGVPGTTWTGLAAGVTMAVAASYARWTRLAGPAVAALMLAQLAPPLLVFEPARQLTDPALWLAVLAYLAAVLAAGNLALQRRLAAAGRALQVGTWAAAGGWLAVAGPAALVALLLAGDPGTAAVAGGALLAGVAGLAGVARATGAGGWATAAATGAVLAAALAAGRVVALAWPGYALVSVAGVAAAATVPALVAGGAPGRRGWRVGGLVAVGTVGVYAAGLTLWAAVVAAARALAEPASLAAGAPADWQLLVALLLLTGALAGLLPGGRYEPVVGGAALLALAAAPALGLPWWAPAAVGVLGAAGLAVSAVRVSTGRHAVAGAGTAAGLAGYALVAGLATYLSLAAVLGALVLAGVGLAVLAARAGGPDGGPPARAAIGRVALVAGLLAWPGAVAVAVAAAGSGAPWPGRAAFAAAATLLVAVAVVGVARAGAVPGYQAAAAGAVHVVTPVALIAGIAEGSGTGARVVEGLATVGAYAGGAAVVLAVLGLLRRPPVRPDGWIVTRLPVVVAAVLGAAPQTAAVLFGPYTWFADPWNGAPADVGVLAGGGWPSGPAAAAGMVLLAAAAGVAGRVFAGRWSAGAGAALLVTPVAVLVGLAQLGAQWPVVPAVALALAVAAVLVAALRAGGRVRAAACAYGLVLAGSALAGALPTEASTLAALGVAVVVAAVVGVAGRTDAVRVLGWVGAVGFAVLLAIAATLAAGQAVPAASFPVLGVGAAALAVTWWYARPPAGAVEAAAHASAVVAILLPAGTAGWDTRAATIAALWGVAVGVHALRRSETAAGRLGRVVAAAGCEVLAWWLLLASARVAMVEAYTLPAALVALAIGWWVLRTRPELGSWVGYGPALAAAALPSLYLVLADPLPLRRLLLGAAAVAVVVAGAVRRRQAPVVVGGGVAGVVALRELGLVWQLLDTWIPLTVAGLLLVGLAATYERRRRDLTRLTAAVRRLT